jgi:4-amino-4-deoxy-L-arabinose transferase-like glycosyltransferase
MDAGSTGPARTWAPFVLLPAAVSVAISLPRVCPTLALLGDSPELVTAAAIGGVAHAPGFPLCTLLLAVVERLPVHELVWRANASSALLHGLTVAVVAAAVRGLTGSRLATVAGAFFLALGTTFALGSLYAEVFPLNDLLFACALCLALQARRRAGGGLGRTLAGLALVAGLASGNQQTIVLSSPALALLVAGPTWRALGARPRRLALYLALFLVPFLGSYALLWRAASHDPPLSWGDVHDLTSLWHLFTRADYWEHFHRTASGGWEGLGRRVALFGALARESVGVVVLGMAALGLVVHGRRNRTEAAALALAFIVTGPLFALLTPLFTATTAPLVSLAARFVTMPMIPLSLLAACGVAGVESGLLRAAPRAPWLAGLVTGCAVLPLVPPALAIDMSDDRRGIALGHDLVGQTPDGSLILVTGDLYVQTADYVCFVERACGHRIVVEPGALFLPWRREQLRRRHPDIAAELPDNPGIGTVHVLVAAEVQRRPVYVMTDFLRSDPALASQPLAPDLLLVRIYPSPAARQDDRERIAARARAMLEDRDCEGCALYSRHSPPNAFHPAEEAIVKLAYAAAYSNEGEAARALLLDDALGSALVTRSAAIASSPP